jgi:hypothetical protein
VQEGEGGMRELPGMAEVVQSTLSLSPASLLHRLCEKVTEHLRYAKQHSKVWNGLP